MFSQRKGIMKSNDSLGIIEKLDPKQGYFILQNFWPVFKFHQILGLFPCKKVRSENGQIKLITMKTWVSILLILSWMLLLIIPTVAIQLYFEMRLSKHIEPIVPKTSSKADVRTHFYDNHFIR